MIFLLLSVEIMMLGTVGIILVYLMVLSILSLFVEKKSSFKTRELHKFAVVIPAHNEEHGISQTLTSVRSMVFPREKFDVIVIADNCNDRTADIARAAEALVLERINPGLRGKGYALRWAFDRLLRDSTYEAFVVIDADSAVSPNFLEVMNFYLEQRAEVIQATDIVAPQEGPWNLEMIRIGFLLHNYVRPMGRRMLGCPTILHGNGMCFSRAALEQIPSQAYSLVEDVEYSLQLLLAGFPASFAPEAVVHAIMPQQQANARSQRIRWESGRFQLIQKHWLPLLRAAVTKKSYQYFDVFLELIIPTLVNTVGFSILCLLISVAATVVDPKLPMAFVLIWIGLVAAGFIHVVVGLYASDAKWYTYRALMNLPRYATWKIVLFIKSMLQGREKEWVRTTREIQEQGEAWKSIAKKSP